MPCRPVLAGTHLLLSLFRSVCSSHWYVSGVAFAEGISSAGPTPGAHCIADSYTCPITQEVCESPVVAADGFTYEEAAIRAWLDTHDTSPLTNECMDHKRLVPNHTLKAAIRALREAGFLHT
eukprot:CAMPEP_0206138702 /NCGR_PEP_ID=MMETSP1473-20131121/3499_1 /ASSEMBLY_ACC=CAM_ASM_001109 /TAXON_ID=1461547 /ORGANISM="Stichococcus sp, Strain RCC1054" /LENGTH=121 /DNA_ID=CAMNT_0053532205 /DNA_START=1250 /DNA_END=1615 /DNA_ORIENTATION=+